MRNDIPTLRILLYLLPVMLFASVTSAEILLKEDFNDGAADGFVTTDNNWQVENGLYRCDLTGADVFSLAMAGDETWTNYNVECDVRVEGSPNNVLAFRIQDEYNFYDINICADPFNAVILTKRVNNSDTWHVVVPYNNTVGEWHHIRVNVFMKRINIWIDDFHLISHTDSKNTYLSGGIATVGYCGWNVNLQTAWFDNVTVYTSKGNPIKAATDLATWDEVKSLFR